ncbi:dipeptide ABC transporter ATP-binding protein [Neobacillus novalis]|uniref:Dipeptide ABC transporter ATP-binding protein n=1 Tax=Neobacillus novalis TaxID=220687 RepID=A0AA95MNA7_9BACI|nr:dipeptide ABC transporter ATP-binding protein [Neobacillus novalis]WHY86585.1 dipeptide ABC transporter ATP-binding protein [Neobacillus novalis]
MTEALLQVKNLKKYFPIKKGILQQTVGHVKAVDNVSFTVNKGETIGIVGESGCGKSTTGKTILRLLEPTDGEIIYKNENLASLSASKLKEYRKEMQIVFQDPFSSLNPRYRIGRILERPMEIHNLYTKKERKQKVAEILQKCGMDPSAVNKFPHEFSGGQRQRIGIARALTLNPNLLILDEPVSALDVSIQSQIINLLEDLQDEMDLTYLFISHDLSVVRHISDRILVMYLGQMFEMSETMALFKEPLHPYTRALLSAIPVHNPTEKRERIVLKGDLPSPSNPPGGCVFHTRCPSAMDICKQVKPDWKQAKDGHFVACHLY